MRQGHEVEYFTLPVRSLLNRCVSRRQMPFTWTINPYRGCEFACKYCYARYTHEFMEMRDGIEFEQKIYAKQHAAELLRQEIRRVKAGEQIAIGTATDPYGVARDLGAIPGVLVGTLIGERVLRRIRDRFFRSVVSAILLVIAMLLLLVWTG